MWSLREEHPVRLLYPRCWCQDAGWSIRAPGKKRWSAFSSQACVVLKLKVGRFRFLGVSAERMGSDLPQQVSSYSLCPPPLPQRPCILLQGKDWGRGWQASSRSTPHATNPTPVCAHPHHHHSFLRGGVVFLLFRAKCFPYDLNLVRFYLLTILSYQSFSCIFMPAFLKNKKEQKPNFIPTILHLFLFTVKFQESPILASHLALTVQSTIMGLLPSSCPVATLRQRPSPHQSSVPFLTDFLGCSMASNPLTTLLSSELPWPQYYQFPPSPSLTEGAASLVLFLCCLLNGDISQDSVFAPCILFSFFLSFFLFIFWLCSTACGILFPQPGIEPKRPALAV